MSCLDLGSMNQLAIRAMDAWSLRAVRVEPLKMRENWVFRITRESGALAVLRIHRPGYHTDAHLRSEFHWLQALEEYGIGVPRVIRSSAGECFETLRCEGSDDPRQVDVFEWINGHQMGSIEDGIAGDGPTVAERCFALGSLCARLHAHTESWRGNAGFSRASWDADGLMGENPIWGRFWELPSLTGPQRQLMLRLRGALLRGLLQYGVDRGDFGLIHADLLPENILIDEERMHVIDFDDSGFGWHLFDLATILFVLRTQPYFDRARDALIRGYRSRRPLSDEQLRHLPLFMAARATTYLGWIQTREPVSRSVGQTDALIRTVCELGEQYLSMA